MMPSCSMEVAAHDKVPDWNHMAVRLMYRPIECHMLQNAIKGCHRIAIA